MNQTAQTLRLCFLAPRVIAASDCRGRGNGTRRFTTEPRVVFFCPFLRETAPPFSLIQSRHPLCPVQFPGQPMIFLPASPPHYLLRVQEFVKADNLVVFLVKHNKTIKCSRARCVQRWSGGVEARAGQGAGLKVCGNVLVSAASSLPRCYMDAIEAHCKVGPTFP